MSVFHTLYYVYLENNKNTHFELCVSYVLYGDWEACMVGKMVPPAPLNKSTPSKPKSENSMFTWISRQYLDAQVALLSTSFIDYKLLYGYMGPYTDPIKQSYITLYTRNTYN